MYNKRKTLINLTAVIVLFLGFSVGNTHAADLSSFYTIGDTNSCPHVIAAFNCTPDFIINSSTGECKTMAQMTSQLDICDNDVVNSKAQKLRCDFNCCWNGDPKAVTCASLSRSFSDCNNPTAACGGCNSGYTEIGGLCIASAYTNGTNIYTSAGSIVPTGGQWVTSGNNIYNSNTGNVGIGTATPTNKFELVTNLQLTGSVSPHLVGDTLLDGGGTKFLSELGVGDKILVGGVIKTVSTIYNDRLLTVNSAFLAAFTDPAPKKLSTFIIKDDGSVGIGATTTNARLDIEVPSGYTGPLIEAGPGNLSTGAFSVSIGNGAKATASGATAIGTGTTASGTSGATAIGSGATASGQGSTAMGYATTSSAWGSTAIGSNSWASEPGSTAMGYWSQAFGQYSTAMGISHANGQYSTAMGSSTTDGQYSTAMGGSTARGFGATAMGYGVTAQAAGSFVTGYNNIVSGDPNLFYNWDPVFVIGNGTVSNPGNIIPSNAMTVLKSGYVGIGTAYPSTLLQVGNTTAQTGTVTTNGIRLLGAGTMFTSELKAHDTIVVGGQIRKVNYVRDDLYLEVDTGFSTTVTGVPYFKLGQVAIGDTAKNPGVSEVPALTIDKANGEAGVFANIHSTDAVKKAQLIFSQGTDIDQKAYVGFNNDTVFHIYNYDITPGGGILFGTGTGGDSVKILPSGNVGIATVTPQSKLGVKGAVVIGDTYAPNNFGPASGLIVEGNVGIGTSAPDLAIKLHVYDSRNGDIAKFENNNIGQLASGIMIQAGPDFYSSLTTQTDYLTLKTHGPSPAVVARLRRNGASSATIASGSDARLKTNIHDYEGALDTVMATRPVKFNFINSPSVENVGFIAQELDDVYPYVVSGDPNGDVRENPMMIDYAGLTPLLTAAIREQQKIIEDLQSQINELKEKLQ